MIDQMISYRLFSLSIFLVICISCAVIQVDSYGWNFNGTWDGAMGLFQQKKVQMLFHATIMRVDRLEQVEFTAEVFVVE